MTCSAYQDMTPFPRLARKCTMTIWPSAAISPSQGRHYCKTHRSGWMSFYTQHFHVLTNMHISSACKMQATHTAMPAHPGELSHLAMTNLQAAWSCTLLECACVPERHPVCFLNCAQPGVPFRSPSKTSFSCFALHPNMLSHVLCIHDCIISLLSCVGTGSNWGRDLG